MPTFQISGPDGSAYSVTAPDENAALNAFSSFHGTPAVQPSAPPPDKYQQAANDEQAALKSEGIDEGAGYTRRLAHGATFGADNTIMAGLTAPFEAIKRGVGLSEGYNYAKAREDRIMNDARQNTGALGTATEILGGGVSGAGLANQGITAARYLAPNAGLLSRSLASAADAGVMGGFSGAMEGNGLNERLSNAAKGAGAGLAVGGALPPALAATGALASPLLSNIRARVNPEGFAQSQVARAVSESGMSPTQIGREVADANANGTPFTVADAMGNAGQRLLSTTARSPGTARTDVVNFLENRQAGQGRRISNALAEGFDAPQTAAQTERALTTARGDAADAAYGQVRNDATPVDISNVLDRIDQTLTPGVNRIVSPQSGIANDSIENALQSFRSQLTDGRSNLTDFNALQRLRFELADKAQNAAQTGLGHRASILRGVVREMDNSLESASPGFRQANADFAQASRNIDAVQTGRDAAMRGRTEDTIPAFRALTPEGQQAFRSGYVDPLISQTQGAAFGANKARPLLNDAFQAESAAVAPKRSQNQMAQKIGREQTMFETRHHALGGSPTAQNLNDDAAMGAAPGLIKNVIMGNWHGAIGSALHAGSNALTGNTPAVRQEVANILLQRGVDPSSLNRMIGETIRRIQFVQNIARNLGRGAAGGLAVSRPGQRR